MCICTDTYVQCVRISDQIILHMQADRYAYANTCQYMTNHMNGCICRTGMFACAHTKTYQYECFRIHANTNTTTNSLTYSLSLPHTHTNTHTHTHTHKHMHRHKHTDICTVHGCT